MSDVVGSSGAVRNQSVLLAWLSSLGGARLSLLVVACDQIVDGGLRFEGKVSAAQIGQVLAGLCAAGLVDESEGVWRLTTAGEASCAAASVSDELFGRMLAAAGEFVGREPL